MPGYHVGMAKLKYHIPLPNGKTAEKITPDYVIHPFAVIGLLKLKRPLPPLNPDDKNEEPRWHSYQDWVVLNTCATQSQVDRVVANPVYPTATLEIRVIPITGEPFKCKPGTKSDDDDDEAPVKPAKGPFQRPTGPPIMQVREFSLAEQPQIPLEESNYILPLKCEDGTVTPVLLEGVTFTSCTSTPMVGATVVAEDQLSDDFDIIDVEDL